MKNINVSSPLLPSFEEFMELSKIAWDNKWLTNNGELHKRLEDELCDYLDVKYISLFSNGTLALITALQALNLKGEVITTPYTFTATANSVLWNNLKPVFVDIDPITMNLDYAEVEKAITKYTSAILPVHVYGEPCNNEKLNQIAERHGLKLIYDAAHAFNVRVNEESILNWGDCSILSFHATKTYSTIEGGAVVCNSLELKNKIDQLKNFGFESVESLPEVGINAKLNEIQCAFGLASLKVIDQSILKRKELSSYYADKLIDSEFLSLPIKRNDVQYNYSYFPVFVSGGLEKRDEVLKRLQNNGVIARKYFYPLVSDFEGFAKSRKLNLKNAEDISNSILCLPLHSELNFSDIDYIINVMEES